MLLKRKLFETLNTILNFAFVVYLVLLAVYALTYRYGTVEGFQPFLLELLNITGWTLCACSLIVCILAVSVWTTEYTFPLGKFLWSLLRAALSIGLILFFNAVETALAGGISIKL